MVGMLNAPSGSRLYERLSKEGRLVRDISGDNTDFSTNIVPRMGYERLAEGYKEILAGIYSPKIYYERVKAFLKEFKPLEKRRRHFHLRSIRYNLHYLDAPFKTSGHPGHKGQGATLLLEARCLVFVQTPPALAHGNNVHGLRVPLQESLWQTLRRYKMMESFQKQVRIKSLPAFSIHREFDLWKGNIDL